MATLDRLDHLSLPRAVVLYRDLLRAHQDRLNRLNVYPVPDGDTGTNMALTLESVVAALESSPSSTMVDTCRCISRGSLMGARGNSGVILSQILRGLCGSLSGAETVDGSGLAAALGQASAAAYTAVMAPVEGTILTVVREAAEAAAACGSAPLVDVLIAARDAARAAVDKTPSLLPVLAAAGVVDSGGSGLALFFDALLAVVDGRIPPAGDDPSLPGASGNELTPARAASGTSVAIEGNPSGPQYEVMFLLEASDQRMDDFKAAWAELGESIVVVGGEGLWNCHIHTDRIGPAIEAGIEVGRPYSISVTDLCEQVAEEQWVRQGLGTDSALATKTSGTPTSVAPTSVAPTSVAPTSVTGPSASGRPMVTAVVAVGSGDAVVRALMELGVARVVHGGQTMNPSTGDVLDAVEAVVTDHPDVESVVVLPNNPNVVGTARQVPALATIPVSVVATTSLVEGIAALIAYEPGRDGATNAASMTRAAGQVVGGEVVRAVRPARLPASDHGGFAGGPVDEGDHLGFLGGEVAVVDSDAVATACALLNRMVLRSHELVTVITGTDATNEGVDAVSTWLAENRPSAAVEVHHWQYPHALYLFSAE